MYIYNMYIVKLGLITPAILINPLSAQKKCNLHTGGPPGFINRLARTLLINPLCWNPILFIQFFLTTFKSFCLSSCLIVILKVLFYCLTPFIFKWFAYAILKLKPHKHQKPSLLIIELLKKKNYSPNDRFPIKFFIKIINLDSSQRVPPMSPCPRLIIITRVPLINQPPWDFKTQILSNPMEFYETLIDFYGFQTISNILWFRGRLFRGKLGKTWQGLCDLVGGWLIRCWH